jgi:hypothetical protein
VLRVFDFAELQPLPWITAAILVGYGQGFVSLTHGSGRRR